MTRLDNEVLANKNKVDKDEVESYIIAGLVTSALHFKKIIVVLKIFLIDFNFEKKKCH